MAGKIKIPKPSLGWDKIVSDTTQRLKEKIKTPENNDGKLHGWYYDLQRESDFLGVSLHSNAIPPSVPGGEWQYYNGDGKEYIPEPICTSIMNEDFNVAVANSWTPFGSDAIGQLWEQVRPLAPYADKVEAAIHELAQEQANMSEEERKKVEGSVVGTAMTKVVDFLDKNVASKDIASYLNKALVVQGTRFSYYSGTGTSFGNLGMRFTVFPRWDGDNFISVNAQLEKMYPYFIGSFDPIDKLTGTSLSEYVSWQSPPGGFKADNKDVDNVQKGTLLLKIGPWYAIENLVCQDVSFTFSKQMVKSPVYRFTHIDELESKESQISPLFCEVQLSLKPATNFSDKKLREFVSGNKRSKDISDVNQGLKDRLEKLKAQNNTYYNNNLTTSLINPTVRGMYDAIL